MLAFAVLTLLKSAEPWLQRQHCSHLVLHVDGADPSSEDLRQLILASGYRITSLAITSAGIRRLEFHLEWYSPQQQDHAPRIVEELSGRAHITCVAWSPISAGHLFE